MSQMIRSGSAAATSVTKSISPRGATSSTISAAMRSTASSSRASMRGVKPAETSLRSRAWRGSSMAIIEPKYSLNSGGLSMIVMPAAELNRSGCLESSRMSAWRVMAQ